MSVSSLPEWKQLLLERKRREEEERERREKEEEKKFANMPAWKRGIIQRRKAKQDSLGDREKDRDVCLLQVDFRAPSDCLSEADSFLTVSLGSELSFSPDPGLWLDADAKPGSQVSVETIVPLHENPFIRTESARRKGRRSEVRNEPEVKEKEKEKSSPRGQDEESRRGRDMELKIDRFRDLGEGQEKERSIDRSQVRERESSREQWEKDKSQWKESIKDAAREREFTKAKKDEEEKETDPPPGSFSPVVRGLRTIRADNIIIIEQDRPGSSERRGRWREVERERPEEDPEGKRGMKMDLRHILAGGGSVTEIRASEVLIIKPSASTDERNLAGGEGGGKGPGREDGETKFNVDGRCDSLSREFRTDMSWLREKEKERPWGQATVIKDDKWDSFDDNVFVDREGRVSQLLSKFGEHPKPPSRSKSSDNFLQSGRRKYSRDDNDQQSEEKRADGRDMVLGTPKRSYSFSDRIVCGKENGLDDDGKMRERIHSDKSAVRLVDTAGLGKETTAKIRHTGCARLRKQRDALRKNESEFSIQHRSKGGKVETVDTRAVEKASDVDGDKGFTVVPVKNTEGISFARRVPIRQDGKARADREEKQLIGEKSLERDLSVEKDTEARGHIGSLKVSDCQREEEFEGTISTETMQRNYTVSASAKLASPCHTAEHQYRHESAFTECSSLLCTVTDRARDLHRGEEWSGTVSQGPYLESSVLSQHTEELISKIEKVGDTTVYKSAYEITKESKQEAQTYSDIELQGLICEATPRSPKRIAPIGISPSPLEIQIPRSVFYVAEEMAERKKSAGQSDQGKDREGGGGVERRDSWRIGKPLSRIESLREKIRQRELEKLRQKEAQDGGGSEGAEMNDTAGDRFDDERGTELEKEWEAAAHMLRSVEVERGQEDAAVQTSLTAFDVTPQEVAVSKSYPQLPVSVQHSEANRGEEVAVSRFDAAGFEVISDCQTSEEEDDPLKQAEDEVRDHRGQQEDTEEEERSDEEEKESSEGEEEAYTSPPDPVQSLSPLPPHQNSLIAMSRIYNLETVGSRSGMSLRDRTVDIPSVHLVKVKPLISNAHQGDSKAFSGEDNICGVQTIQRQIEQFQLKEQEALRSCTSTNNPPKDRGTKGQQCLRGGLKHQAKDYDKTHEKDQETSGSNPKVSPHQRVCSPTSELKQSNQTITINHSLLRSQSPDNILNPSDCAPTPAPSPCPPSPAQSPSVSPSPTPSPPLFSIRSATGVNVKRGATITISPRKNAGEGGGGGGGGGVKVSAKGTTTAGSGPAKVLSQQAQIAPIVASPVKKKYPTVDEIEVIGGYQNLDNSCLVKIKGNPKRGKVCFREDQLEEVCEYPSETSMLASTPFPHDPWKTDKLQGEEDDEAEVEGGPAVTKGTSSVGIAKGRGLRVDESCPR